MKKDRRLVSYVLKKIDEHIFYAECEVRRAKQMAEGVDDDYSTKGP